MTTLFFLTSLLFGWIAWNLYHPNFTSMRLGLVSFVAGLVAGELAARAEVRDRKVRARPLEELGAGLHGTEPILRSGPQVGGAVHAQKRVVKRLMHALSRTDDLGHLKPSF